MLNFGLLAQPGTTCLAPLGGTFAAHPTVAACNGTTNMLVGPAAEPDRRLGVLLRCAERGCSNFTATISIPGFVGVYGSTQALVFDYTAGFAVTEAFNWLIVP